jgi:hypothetical protein
MSRNHSEMKNTILLPYSQELLNLEHVSNAYVEDRHRKSHDWVTRRILKVIPWKTYTTVETWTEYVICFAAQAQQYTIYYGRDKAKRDGDFKYLSNQATNE